MAYLETALVMGLGLSLGNYSYYFYTFVVCLFNLESILLEAREYTAKQFEQTLTILYISSKLWKLIMCDCFCCLVRAISSLVTLNRG